MNKLTALVSGLVLALLSALVFAEMGMMNGNGMKCMMNMSMDRHHYVMKNGLGPEYSSRKNPLVAKNDILHTGKTLYEENCSSCHGKSGSGDGPAGANLNPRPTNIAGFSKMPMATDEYLFWTISEGGIPIQTAMPAFKSSLTEEEIWNIVIYLHNM
jgi:cytochrome c